MCREFVKRLRASFLWRVMAATLALAVLTGCAARTQITPTAVPAEAAYPLYVVRHSWHTGIVVPAAQIPSSAWPAHDRLADAEYLEVGWGDRDFYQAARPGLWLGMRALLWPTPGALHIVAFKGPVETFPGAEILELRVSAAGLERLIARVRESHELDATGRAIALGPALYGTGRFYASREQFHLFKTCNVWVATLLHEAGVPIDAGSALTASNLLSQLRPHARVIRAD